jgi:hypothetical protein
MPEYTAVALMRDPAQIVDLVAHQSDKRGNDKANPFHRQCRNLEGDRFAASRRHQAERVSSGTDGMDNILL